MDNYQLCALWVAEHAAQPNVRVLDYGCGAGHIVEELRRRGFPAFGCDIYYEGGDYSVSVRQELWDDAIRKMENSTIPFGDSEFDIVVNNMVFEHVADLDAVLAEITRVLKPGGMVLSVFPDRGIWREGHCGIPFLHWFAKGGRARIAYAAVLRRCGLGYHPNGKGAWEWSADFCRWLDAWTYYRPLGEIERTFRRHFISTTRAEEWWLSRQVRGARLVPAFLQRAVMRRLSTLVLVSRARS